MLFDSSMYRLSKSTTLQCVALYAVLFFPAILHAEESTSYVSQIQKYVDEDKVYLLENIRQKVTRPSEQTVIDALLSEDGPQAVSLYRKQLREYPDPAIDKLSSSRIAAYNLALESSDSRPKFPGTKRLPQQFSPGMPDSAKQSDSAHIRIVSSSKPQTAAAEDTTKKETATRPNTAPFSVTLKQEKSLTGPGTCTLQFGSFSSRENAEILAKKISGHAAVEVIVQGQMHKVQLKKYYASNEEAAAAAKKLPFDAIIVSVR
jgi:septal ring-binding cell division protein DamX